MKPDIVLQIEKTLGVVLYPAPVRGDDPVSGVMPVKEQQLHRYALRDGYLAGLNLYNAALTDMQWRNICTLPGFEAGRLEALNLRGNQLVQPPLSAGMTALRFVDVSDNKLSDFSLPEGATALKHLFLYDNEGLDQVLQTNIQQGRHVLVQYLNEINTAGADELYEARLLIIGEPRAGKTSLRRKLKSEKNQLADASTKGIDLDIDHERLEFPYTTPSGKKVMFRYQVWDFGGQREYHPAHQLFFSKGALYLLVSNTNRSKNEEDVTFWLETVKKLGEGSPVIHLKNAESDSADSSDWSAVHKRFGDMIKNRVFTLNLNRINKEDPKFYREKDYKEFMALKDAVEYELKHLKRVGSRVSASFAKIRADLAETSRKLPYISLDQYRDICQKHGIADYDRQLSLSETFHELGVIRHYQHSKGKLSNIVILQNEWAIDAVFTVIDCQLVKDNKGHFTDQELPKIWHQKRYERKENELLELMRTFGLCYPLIGDKGYVAPQLLDKSPPEGEQYTWDESNNVLVDVVYDFLPKAIITRLIVALHELIPHDRSWVWQAGVVIDGTARQYKDTQAYIQKERYPNERIKIRLRGPYSELLFGEIRAKLSDIHQEFTTVVAGYELYCPCVICRQSNKPTLYKYQTLLRYLHESKTETIECQNLVGQVKISEILSGVISSEEATNEHGIGGLGYRMKQVEGQINALNAKETNITINMEPNHEQSNSSIYGALTAFVVILPVIAYSISQLEPLKAVLTIASTILMMMLILVFAGTQNKTLSEDAFVKLSERILNKIPGLDYIINLIKGK
jgi:internalin A